jgi:CelD/BcsL family acetyltransferase involved in cellulose biosynthesis
MESTTALAGPAGVLTPRADGGLRIEVASDLPAVEDLWRALEEKGGASPYQRFDWVAAYVAAHGETPGFEPRVLVVRDRAGDTLMVLP